MEQPSIIVFCKETKQCELIEVLLYRLSLQTKCFSDMEKLLHFLDTTGKTPDVLLADFSSFDDSAKTLLSTCQDNYPQLCLLIVLPEKAKTDGLEFLKNGAADVLFKPLVPHKISPAITRLSHQSAYLTGQSSSSPLIPSLSGTSSQIQSLKDALQHAAKLNTHILMESETGQEKEKLAFLIHNQSKKRESPFVTVNCRALPKEMVTPILFGDETRPGKFRDAADGTLLLGDISVLDDATISNITQITETGMIEQPTGRTCQSKARLIVTINPEHSEEISRTPALRHLFYGVSAFTLSIPPLRKRKKDIGLIADLFLKEVCVQENFPLKELSGEAVRQLSRYYWPGNERQLFNTLYRGCIHTEEHTIEPEHFMPLDPQTFMTNTQETNPGPQNGSLLPLTKVEENHIRHAINLCGGSMTHAAKKLGIGRATLYRKLKEYNIEKS